MQSGEKFKQALKLEKPLQIVGVINAYNALLAKQAGFQAIYLSGAGIANAAYGLPDLGMTSLTEVVEEVRRITATVDLPLLVDGDTGWGSALNVGRTVKELIRAGAAGVHFEDQSWPKRCGHRPGKKLVSKTEMVDRIHAAVEAKTDSHFVIVARTDALAEEGIESALDRAKAYVHAGAEILFAEAVTELTQYQQFVEAVSVPVLANITEFGKTPLFTITELKSVGVGCVLYPLSAFRAMSEAANRVYQTIRKEGSQKSRIGEMQTRTDLYQVLNYQDYESKL